MLLVGMVATKCHYICCQNNEDVCCQVPAAKTATHAGTCSGLYPVDLWQDMCLSNERNA